MAQRTEIEAIARQGARRWPARAAALAVVAAGVAGLFYYLSIRGEATATRYVTAEVRHADIIVTVTATGTIEPTNQVDISSELSGRVRSVEVDYNDMVKRGQVLARLDTDRLEANVEHAEATLLARKASLAEAVATLNERRDTHERIARLEQQGIATRETLLAAKAALERAEAGVESARANVRVAEASLKLERTNLDKACICSPIDGIVLARTVEPGQVVAATLQAPTLFTLAEGLSRMRLTVDVDEADIGKVNTGNRAEFTVEAFQDRRFEAVISQLRFAPRTIDGVVTYEAILDVDNDDLALRPGMTATAEITVARVDGALAVPNAALRYTPSAEGDEGQSGRGLLGMLLPRPPRGTTRPATTAGQDGRRPVWVLRDGAPVEVRIRTGETDGLVTQLLDGDLAAGDAVIVDAEVTR
ncbi:MAG: hemolysin secretion protein D [Alphaproteobacteria bacterium]|nr:MAG: hemolysin secretion protein D [Alphaproteobacteria bacterium]